LKINQTKAASTATGKKAASMLVPDSLQELIVEGMKDRKAKNIAVLDLRNVKNAIADFFIVCSGTSDTQVDAITDSVEDKVWKATRQNPAHKEGKANREWILLDYVDIVAHVFKHDKRKYYALEELWGDAIIHYVPDTDI
jgi:ribosome-associated protein